MSTCVKHEKDDGAEVTRKSVYYNSSFGLYVGGTGCGFQPGFCELVCVFLYILFNLKILK